MNMNDNARLTPKGRGILIERLERGERPQDVAGAMGVSARTVYKWKRRFLEHGLAGQTTVGQWTTLRVSRDDQCDLSKD